MSQSIEPWPASSSVSWPSCFCYPTRLTNFLTWFSWTITGCKNRCKKTFSWQAKPLSKKTVFKSQQESQRMMGVEKWSKTRRSASWRCMRKSGAKTMTKTIPLDSEKSKPVCVKQRTSTIQMVGVMGADFISLIRSQRKTLSPMGPKWSAFSRIRSKFMATMTQALLTISC